MKIFIDSANFVEIEEALARGFPAGITTNPSILSKEQKGDFKNTEVGLAMRGAAQNRRAAALMGIDPDLAASAARDLNHVSTPVGKSPAAH